MSRIHSLVVIAVLILIVAFCKEGPRTYYFSSSIGDDRNNGLSENRPWKSLNKVNSIVFGPGIVTIP
jgi:hypothetical protein